MLPVEVASLSMLLSKAPKIQYSETEAAALLGLSVEQLRTLVRDHIVTEEQDDSEGLEYATFHPSDLLVLRILAAKNSAYAGSPAR